MRTMPAVARWCHLIPLLRAGIEDADLYMFCTFHQRYLLPLYKFFLRSCFGGIANFPMTISLG